MITGHDNRDAPRHSLYDDPKQVLPAHSQAGSSRCFNSDPTASAVTRTCRPTRRTRASARSNARSVRPAPRHRWAANVQTAAENLCRVLAARRASWRNIRHRRSAYSNHKDASPRSLESMNHTTCLPLALAVPLLFDLSSETTQPIFLYVAPIRRL